jgi:phosphoribosyl-ATP pyrophosphohydrolase/phosphoribosyl-AMP cyclohydrolase
MDGVSRPAPRFDANGLIPAIVQDAASGAVLMFGFMNEASLTKTRETGLATFWSRSRQALWTKGETSGNVLRVREIRIDCDSDALLVLADPAGPACHTGEPSCFFREIGEEPILAPAKPSRSETVLDEVYRVIESRRRDRPEGSYTTYLFENGVDKIGKKIGEEAAEVIIAAKNGDPVPFAGEVADLLYHTLVMMAAVGVTPAQVLDVLQKRRR